MPPSPLFPISELPKNLYQYKHLLTGFEALSHSMRLKTRALLGCTDLYFLLCYMLNRHDARNEFVFDRCREVQQFPNDYLDLWAREHYKSTIITFALTIQDILNDPEITIGIFSHTRPNAKGFLNQIKREFEINADLKETYPHILYQNPEIEALKWSEDDGIIVKRKTNPKEATVEAWGLVDGMPTSKHFKLRVYDDVVTEKSVTTAEQIEKTTKAWELSDNLGTVGGATRMIGTRYHLSDTYATILKRKAVIPRIYPATNNGRMDGKPILFSQEEWDRRKRRSSRRTLAAQMLQNPLADEDATFNIFWLRSYEIRPRTLNISITCDPSKGKHVHSDNTAIAVVGYATGGAKFLLDGYCHRMTLSQRWVAIRDLYKKWSKEPGVQSVEVGYERYGAQSDDEYFEERMRLESKTDKLAEFPMQELNWVREGSQSKRHRIERLEPDFRNSRFFLPMAIFREGKPYIWWVGDDPESREYGTICYREVDGFTKSQQKALDSEEPHLISRVIKRVDQDNRLYDLTARFLDEYLNFPATEHDDFLDTLSRCYDMNMLAPENVTRSKTESRVYVDS